MYPKNITHRSAVRPMLMFAATLFLAVTTTATPGAQPPTANGASRIQVNGASVVLHDDDTYQVELKDREVSRKLPVRRHIKLRDHTFDPLAPGTVPERLRATEPAAGELQRGNAAAGVGSYIVQFHTQALPEYQQQLEDLGAQIVAPLPEQAVIAYMDRNMQNAVARLPFVRWVGDYLPAYKIAPGLEKALTGPSARYSLMVFEPSQQLTLADFIESIGGEVHYRSDTSRFEASLSGPQLSQVTQRIELQFIERATPIGHDMNQVRETMRANFLQTVANYTGQGVAGEALDEGFLLSHAELMNANTMVHSPQATGPSGDTNHGSQVAGILFAKGTNAQARGMLPDAARAIVFARSSGFSTGFPTISELRTNLQQLTNPTGPYRAVFQTSSFGREPTLDYTTVSAEYDEVLFEIDILRTQSQSNTGTRQSRPEAWAKNIVSVGGLATGETLSRDDDVWTTASIGPATDGRIKPDLVAQYGGVFTMLGSNNTAYGNFGGTSGATPIVAGSFGLLYQMWADGVFDGGTGKQGAPLFRDVFSSRPHAATARALLINSAYQYGFNSTTHNLTRTHQGWGMPDLQNLYEIAQGRNWSLPLLINETEVLAPLQTHTYNVASNGTSPLKVTMVYKDRRGNPASSVHRVNDLSLKATSPSGVVYWGNNGLLAGNWSTPGGAPNTVDTVENIFIRTPEAGTWQIQVSGDEIVQDGYPATPAIDAVYALVATTNSAETNNRLPTAEANGPYTATINVPINFSSAGSTDPDGTIVSYLWNFGDGSTSTLANPSHSYSTAGSKAVTLTVTDDRGGSATDSATTTITSSANQAPAVNAGPDLNVVRPNAATLNGTVTDDGLPSGTLTIAWSKVSGPGTVSFVSPNTASTNAFFSSNGTYVLRLTASDSVATSTDDVTVIVTGNAVAYETKTSSGGADAEQSATGVVTLSSANLRLGDNQWVGLRFGGIPIDRNKTIANAYIQFTADAVGNAPTSITIYGQASDDAPAFAATTNNLSSRTRTSASVTWTPPAWPTVGERSFNQRTVDIKPILQELVNRPGWVFNGNIVILMNGSGLRQAESYEGASAKSALIHIDYVP